MSELPNRIVPSGDKRRLTLDMAGLSENERADGSILLGGSGVEFVTQEEAFDYSRVDTLVFNWGDPAATPAFNALLEYDPKHPRDFPFGASTILGPRVWSLTIQYPDFDPTRAYEDVRQFIPLDYDQGIAGDVEQYLARAPLPRSEFLGKVGTRWVAFENSMLIRQSITIPEEAVEKDPSTERVFQLLEELIDDWDFEGRPIEESNRLALTIAHWVTEAFGQEDIDGHFHLFADSKGEGFKGKKVPDGLKELLVREWQDKLFFSDENEIQMETDPQYIPIQQAEIPGLNKELGSLDAMVKDLLSREGALEGMKRSITGILPQIRLSFEPAEYNGWDIEFLISEQGILAMPLGRDKRIQKVVEYTNRINNSPKELAKTTSKLALLGARYAQQRISGTIPFDYVLSLQQRLAGSAEAPLIKGREYRGWRDDAFIRLPLKQAES